jgi:branched-chain amino acid transport system permease protein
VFAIVIGFFSIRHYGIYFAIFTLAFGQILFFLSQQLEITGGSHGLIGLFERPPVELTVFTYDLNNVVQLYGFVAPVIVEVLYFLSQFLNSQLGSVLVAVRENESRAAAIGYDVRRVKFLAFVISGAITGLAGSLYTIYLGLATPDLLNWTLSGELLFIVILGGARTFFGPVAGTVIYFSLEEGIRTFTDRWQFFVGLLFLLLVHFAPKGVLGSLRETGERLFLGD